MDNFEDLIQLKNDADKMKDEFKKDFYAENEDLAELQKERDDLYIQYGLKSPSLDTSDGLYSVAVQNGLEDKANKVVQDNSGEEYKKIFSGGFISDIFDVLNTVSYGVVGTLKGKGFVEGVKNRESFADDDALGQYGLVGAIGGIALDIATDPLTYIAPYTLAKKVPGLVRIAKFSKEAAFGKMVERTVESGGKVKKFQELQGGNIAGRYVAEKLSFMYGADNIFKETWQRMTRNIGIETVATRDMMRGLSKLDKDLNGKLAETIFAENTTSRLIRKPLSDIQRELDQTSFEKVKAVYDNIDNMGKELVDLGVLSKDRYTENLGEYMHQYYQKYIDAQKKPFGLGKPSIKGTKARSDTLTKEGIEALGRVENPGYVLGRTMIEMRKDIENAKLFKKVNDLYATTKEMPGFTKLPDTARLNTNFGKITDLRTNLGKANEDLKPLLKELKTTFKEDKKLMSEITGIEKEISKLKGMTSTELSKFFSEGAVGLKEISPKAVIHGAAKLPDQLQMLGRTMEKELRVGDLSKATDIKLDKLDIEGVLQEHNFTKDGLIKFIKEPFKKGKEEIKATKITGNMSKILAMRKQVARIIPKAEKLSNIDKKSLNNLFIDLEKQISDIKFAKEDILEEIAVNKVGQLSGKYVPDYIAKNILPEMTSPVEKTMGERVMGEFKFAKVILSPAAMVRNLLSNLTLNYWKLGIIPGSPEYFKVLKEMKDGGGKLTDLARPLGYRADSMAANEIYSIMDVPSTNKAKKVIDNIKGKFARVYQGEESFAKLAAFSHQLKKGFKPEEAWKLAQSATFNYAEVTPFVRKMRTATWGVPFVTFPLKATPLVIETALKHPARISVIGKIRNAIEEQSDYDETMREKASEPQWIKDGFFVKLPIKDSEGRSAFFDLTYILPFGDLLSGQFVDRSISRETGVKESLVMSVASKNPFFNVLKELSKNQDFSGNKIWKDSDTVEKQLAEISRHLFKMMAPPPIADQIPAGYNSKNERVTSGLYKALTKEQKDTQRRTLAQELLKSVGMKIQPIDVDIQESMNEWQQKKGLRTILRDENVVKDFSSSYIPK